jgi:hypothetical protein
MSRSNRQNAKGRKDAPGGFAGIPRVVMKHPDYVALSPSAKALLFELAYQYKGKNNGDLTVAISVLQERGFRSRTTVTKATGELLAARLIVQTRQGRFTNPGGVCALYAVTWVPVDECEGKGLEITPTTTPLRKFSLEAIKTPCTESGHGSVQNLDIVRADLNKNQSKVADFEAHHDQKLYRYGTSP